MGRKRLIWSWAALVLLGASRVAAGELPNDPMEPIASARGAFSRKDDDHAPTSNGSGSCATGDTSQRDDLLAKIKANGAVTTKAE